MLLPGRNSARERVPSGCRFCYRFASLCHLFEPLIVVALFRDEMPIELDPCSVAVDMYRQSRVSFRSEKAEPKKLVDFFYFLPAVCVTGGWINDISAEVLQTREARLRSAASRAAVYFAICCLMASVAALTSSALLRDDPHDTIKATATHRLNARARTATALFGFLSAP